MPDNIKISVEQFELILDDVVARLTDDLRNNIEYHTPDAFEEHVKTVMKSEFCNFGITVKPTFHASAFPDIKVGSFGVEVKYTNKDRWHTVGNSIFEGMRDEDVKNIYLVFGKGGGTPEVRWSRYEDCITDVRLTHAPRFTIDMNQPTLLFGNINISYDDFSKLDEEDKLITIKEYYSNRLQPEERLWWMEEPRALPMQVRLYAKLSQYEKNTIRGEAAILCPQICGNSQTKFIDAALFLFRHHGIFCPNVRDLFTSGFAAAEGDRMSRSQTSDSKRHILHTLRGLQSFMLEAIQTLDEELFAEYWGQVYPTEKRLGEWLSRADSHAKGWIPSESLFAERSGADELTESRDLRLFEL